MSPGHFAARSPGPWAVFEHMGPFDSLDGRIQQLGTLAPGFSMICVFFSWLGRGLEGLV